MSETKKNGLGAEGGVRRSRQSALVIRRKRGWRKQTEAFSGQSSKNLVMRRTLCASVPQQKSPNHFLTLLIVAMMDKNML